MGTRHISPGAAELLAGEELTMFADALLDELATEMLDTRTLSLLEVKDATRKERLCKNLVRRLTGEAVPADPEGQDADPVQHGQAWRPLVMKIGRVQSRAREVHEEAWRRSKESDGKAEGGGARGRKLTAEEYRSLAARWQASPGSGGLLAAEPFLPDRETAGAWRNAFTQDKAEGETTTIEWLGFDELPLSKVGALKGPHVRPAGEPRSALATYERNELTLDAAEWNSIGRRAPAGYTCKPLDAQREIFSHEARQKVSAGLRTLLSATDGLPAEKARAAMLAACRRVHEDLRVAVLGNVTPTVAVDGCIVTLRAQLAQVDRDAAAEREKGAWVASEGEESLVMRLAQALAGGEPQGLKGLEEALRRLSRGGGSGVGPNNARNRATKARRQGVKVDAAAQVAKAAKGADKRKVKEEEAHGREDTLEKILALLRGTSKPPSTEKCRNFAAGRCKRGDACPYVHGA